MSQITDFYDNPDLADGFGSTAGDRANSHRGLDFAHGLGTPVPSLGAGVVVTSTEDSALGCLVEVQQDDGRFVGYRHLRRSAARVKVGERVGFGTIIGQVSDTGSAANGYHLCTTNASAKGGVYGDSKLVTDPWPWIKFYVFGGPRPGSAPAGSSIGPVLRSGSDWAIRLPQGELAKQIARELIKKGRLAPDYNNDGAPGPEWEKGVQRTLAASGIFPSTIDGKLERGGAYGVQDYGIKFGRYLQRGGKRDGRPETISWEAFRDGLPG